MRRTTARFWERAFSEPGLGRNLAAVGFLVVIGTVFAAYFLSHQRFNPPWEDKYTVYAEFEEAAAISPGNGQEVRIAGVEVGDIRSADVTEDGRARLELRIDSDQEIHSDAKLLLRPKSPLNDMYIEINPGSPDKKTLADGDTVPMEQTVSPVQVDDVLAHVDTNTQAALTSLLAESDVALVNARKQLPGGLVETKELLKQLQPVMSRLEVRREKLAKLVNALADVSEAAGANDERLARMAGSLSKTLDTMAGRSGDLDATIRQLPELSHELRTTSTAVTRLAGQLNPTLKNVHRASDELPGALSRFGDSVDELDGFLDHARPVLDRAGPVVGDLRAAVPNVRRVAGDLRPLSANAKPLTQHAVPRLDDVAAFVYNTNSVASLRDANRGILRGFFTVSADQSLPLGTGAQR